MSEKEAVSVPTADGFFSANCYTVHAASEQTAQLISQLSAVFSALCIMSF